MTDASPIEYLYTDGRRLDSYVSQVDSLTVDTRASSDVTVVLTWMPKVEYKRHTETRARTVHEKAVCLLRHLSATDTLYTAGQPAMGHGNFYFEPCAATRVVLPGDQARVGRSARGLRFWVAATAGGPLFVIEDYPHKDGEPQQSSGYASLRRFVAEMPRLTQVAEIAEWRTEAIAFFADPLARLARAGCQLDERRDVTMLYRIRMLSEMVTVAYAVMICDGHVPLTAWVPGR